MQERNRSINDSRLPAEFKNTIISIHGKAGEEWLTGFDELISYCINKWHFKLLPAKKLFYNFVTPVRRWLKSNFEIGYFGRWLTFRNSRLKSF
jgi:hypothetical protein